MKIVLASPLYPPDIAEPGPYIKELATRLRSEHEVTLAVYANHPEIVSGVRILSVRKNAPLPFRLIAYFFTLLRAVRGADLLYVENGASVELPAGLVARLTGKPLYLHIGDAKAHARATGVRRAIERFAGNGARMLTDMPPSRPEILPLSPRPAAALDRYASAWDEHVRALNTVFRHG